MVYIEGNEWKVWQAHRFNDGWIWTTEVRTWKHKAPMKKELQKLIKALEVTKVPQKVPDGWYTLAEIAKSKNKSICEHQQDDANRHQERGRRGQEVHHTTRQSEGTV